MRQYPFFTSVILISGLFLAACSPPISISTLSLAPTEGTHLSVTPLEEEQPVISGTPLPLLPLPVTEEVTFTITGQVGSTLNAVATDGNIVYLGVGPRLLTVDITHPAAPQPPDLPAPRMEWVDATRFIFVRELDPYRHQRELRLGQIGGESVSVGPCNAEYCSYVFNVESAPLG